MQVQLLSEQLVTRCRFLRCSSLTGLVDAWGPVFKITAAKEEEKKKVVPASPGLLGSVDPASAARRPRVAFFSPSLANFFAHRSQSSLLNLDDSKPMTNWIIKATSQEAWVDPSSGICSDLFSPR